jgi:hypothetical protein
MALPTAAKREAKRLVMENFISELASMYLPTEDGPEASELAFLRVIMEARVIERDYIEPSERITFPCGEDAVGIWGDAPEVE